ncbi:hypothetical protein [Microbacterium sp. MMO-10]|uniref:hypothetical protein n=1 Tax=Microbacterium sp. MMO-10 TaxID=3081272 RepID=UPI003015B3F4
MSRRSLLPVLAIAPLLAALVGCAQLQNVADSAGKAATDEITRQICAPLKDGVITTQDQQALGALVTTAKAAGIGGELLTSLEEVANAGDQIPAQAVSSLLKACNITPSSGAQ